MLVLPSVARHEMGGFVSIPEVVRLGATTTEVVVDGIHGNAITECRGVTGEEIAAVSWIGDGPSL